MESCHLRIILFIFPLNFSFSDDPLPPPHPLSPKKARQLKGKWVTQHVVLISKEA